MDTRIAKLMIATAQRFAALPEHTFKIIAAMLDSDAIARLTITALPAVAPKVAGAGTFFFFHLTAPQDAVTTRRALPGAVAIGDATRSLVGFAGLRPPIAARIPPAAIQILNAGHTHTTPWLTRNEAAG